MTRSPVLSAFTEPTGAAAITGTADRSRSTARRPSSTLLVLVRRSLRSGIDKKVARQLSYRQCIDRIEIIPLRELRRFDLNLLVVLHTVLETRNVTQAARRLNMSQPAVSRALARLRAVFDDPLFVKGAKGVIATPRAKTLQGRMAALLAELGAAIEQPRFDPVSSTRTFRIATTDYGALAVLAPVIGNLLEEGPGIKVDILPLTGATFAELGSGDIDVALYSDDPPPVPLLSRPVFDESYATVLRTGHPALAASTDASLPMESFLAYGHILVNIGGDRAGVIDAGLAALGLSRSIDVTLPYFATAALIAAQTDLLLTIPSRVADRMAKPHGLVIIHPPIELEGFGYRLLWHIRTDRDPGSRWLRDQICEPICNA